MGGIVVFTCTSRPKIDPLPAIHVPRPSYTGYTGSCVVNITDSVRRECRYLRRPIFFSAVNSNRYTWTRHDARKQRPERDPQAEATSFVMSLLALPSAARTAHRAQLHKNRECCTPGVCRASVWEGQGAWREGSLLATIFCGPPVSWCCVGLGALLFV